MKPKYSLKTLYRSPVRTILTFILLAAVTFALFSQVMEYAIANREMKKAVEQYDGVMTVQSANPANTDASNPQYMYADTRVSVDNLPKFLAEGFRHLKTIPLSDYIMEEISALPYISYIDTRYMTGGYSDEYMRLDDGRNYYNYTNQCVIEATVTHKVYERITVRDVELIGGDAKRWFDEEGTFIWAEDTKGFNQQIELYAPVAYETALKISREQGGDVPEYDEFLEEYRGQQILYNITGAERATNLVTENSKYGTDFFETLEIGKRYIFVLRYDDYAVNFIDTENYYLTDPFVEEYCDAVIPVDGLPENYIESEEFAGLRAYIDRIERNLYTFDVVYTKNSGSIRYFADGTVGISEGRGIKIDDTENKNNVCIIHHDVAQAYGLNVGDTITINLGDKLFEQYASKGAIDVSPAQAPENLTEATLEIVGIFKDTRSDDLLTADPCWSYSINTIFVPQHLLNVSEEELENYKSAPAEISFVIDNAWDIPAFEEECVPLVKKMKMRTFFSDNGWKDLIDGYRETERLTLIKLAVLMASVFVSTCFIAFLYIVAKRHDYAIMRVLGTSKRKSGNALLLPLFVITCVAVFAGGAAAMIYTAKTVADSDSLQYLSGMVQIDTGIPPMAVAACIIGEIVLTLLIAEALLAMIGSNSPLALIQAHTQRLNRRLERKRKKKEAAIVPESAEPVVLGQWVSIEPVKRDGKKRKFKFAAKYIFRHIRRTKGKAVMLLLVTALLLSVAAQLLIMDASYNRLFEETEIISNYAGYLNLKYVNELINSGHVKDVFYHETTAAEINGVGLQTIVTSDVQRCTLEQLEITWLEGYNEDSMEQLNDRVTVLGAALMDRFDLSLGDTIHVAENGTYREATDKYMTMYVREFGAAPPLYIDDEINEEYDAWNIGFEEKYRDDIEAEYLKHSDEFLVIGSVTSNNHTMDLTMFLNGCMELNIVYGKLAVLDEIEATLIDNWKADEYREYGEALAAANLTGEVAFIMDTSKLDNILNNIRLMDMLYPIVVAAILVIGAFLCGLLIVQTSKDIAIMRVLGTSKRRVRLIMIAEHAIVCLVGIIAAFAVAYLRKASISVINDVSIVCCMYFAAILLASIVASAMASRKNVLELLQTKE